jgi:hypothetical protein
VWSSQEFCRSDRVDLRGLRINVRQAAIAVESVGVPVRLDGSWCRDYQPDDE